MFYGNAALYSSSYINQKSNPEPSYVTLTIRLTKSLSKKETIQQNLTVNRQIQNQKYPYKVNPTRESNLTATQSHKTYIPNRKSLKKSTIS